ncbi:hypothetical protein AB0B66_30960 [Catellatospora sp. NPDC049111]|uniref:hypothetical protein n=1 Tax=Catellatospora sp. NPDC049111 TaxID=3155271 RepID=UPI0034002B61
MAMSLADVEAVRAAAHASGRVYMMMETSVYAREYHAVEELHRSGELGTVTFYRGFHIQNLDGFAHYWQGYPPMAYVTHALSPILALLDTSVASVHCLGSGRLTGEREGAFGNPYPLETGLFRLRGHDAVAEISRVRRHLFCRTERGGAAAPVMSTGLRPRRQCRPASAQTT